MRRKKNLKYSFLNLNLFSFFCRFCDVTKDQVFNTTCHHIFKWAPQVWRQWNHHLMVSISRRAMSTKLAYSCRCLWLLSFAWWISFQGSRRPPLYGAAVHTPINLTPPSTTPWGSSPVAWNPLQPSSCQYYLALHQRPYVENTTHTDLCPRHCKTHTTSYTITSRALPILDVNAHPIVSIFQMYSTDEMCPAWCLFRRSIMTMKLAPSCQYFRYVLLMKCAPNGVYSVSSPGVCCEEHYDSKIEWNRPHRVHISDIF